MKPYLTRAGQVRHNLANKREHLHRNDARIGLQSCRCGTCHCCRMANFIARYFRRFGKLLGIALLATSASAAQPSATEVVAAVIVAEAGGEGYAGMRAVREVIQMRAYERQQTERAVVTAPKQFSCLNRTTPERLVAAARRSSTWNTALTLASRPVDRATVWQANHYHALTVRPAWAAGKRPVAITGGHVFYRF